jgi:prepilin-type N-terminal cleavage/methylation domain-containing protein
LTIVFSCAIITEIFKKNDAQVITEIEMKTQPAQGGYTLVEMITVVLVLSLFVTIATPYFLGWLHQYRLEAATVVLANHLRTARLLSIYTGVNHQIQIKKMGAGNYYQVVNDPGGADIVIASIGRVVLDKRFGEVMIQRAPSSGRITFSPKGTSNPATILLENAPGAQVRVIVSNFGRIRVEYL